MNSHRICVIGLGYVGLPLLQEISRVGMPSVGFDISEDVVAGLNSGVSHVDDISDADVAQMLAGGFRATTSTAAIASADVYVLCVPTPLSEDGGPDLRAVQSASRIVSSVVSPGDLVVLESTSYPGTTEDLVGTILAASGLKPGVDFHLAFSPERIDPGNPRYGLRNTPKVVGGVNPESTEAAAQFYRHVCDEIVLTKGTREAEMAKLLENTYRQVNIALMNELVRFAHTMGVDLWDAIAAARTKPFGFQAFYPGPGVGGHCIPIDPSYLSHHVRSNLGQAFRFVELAQEINHSMPAYVARRVQNLLNRRGRPVMDNAVLLLGVTYKADIADQRESPSKPVAEALLKLGARLYYWDPYVDFWEVAGRQIPRVTDLTQPNADFQCVVVLVNHSELKEVDLSGWADQILDTRGALDIGERL